MSFSWATAPYWITFGGIAVFLLYVAFRMETYDWWNR